MTSKFQDNVARALAIVKAQFHRRFFGSPGTVPMGEVRCPVCSNYLAELTSDLHDLVNENKELEEKLSQLDPGADELMLVEEVHYLRQSLEEIAKGLLPWDNGCHVAGMSRVANIARVAVEGEGL